MSNIQKDLVLDYFREYPVLRYIMPGLSVGFINISHRVLMLRQALWVMARILDADDDKYFGGPAGAAVIAGIPGWQLIQGNAPPAAGLAVATSYPVAVKDINLTAEDVALVGIFLNAAAVTFDAFTDAQKDAVRAAIQSGKVLSDIPRAVAAGGAVLGVPYAAAPQNFNVLLDALSDEIGANKVNRLKDLITATRANVGAAQGPVLGVANPLVHLGAPPAIPNLGTITTTPGFQPCTCITFHNIDIGSLFRVTANIVPANTWALFQNAVTTDAAGNVYLIASRAAASYFGAQVMNITRQSGKYRHEFVQGPTGLFELHTYDGQTLKTTDFTAQLTKLASRGDFCKVFGGSGSHPVCSTMVNDCLGNAGYDVAKCQTHFRRLPEVSTNLKGWNQLHDEEKRYFSYRVLLGLGFHPARDSQGNPTYLNAGQLAYSDADIITQLKLAGAPAEGYFTNATGMIAAFAPVAGLPGSVVAGAVPTTAAIDQLNTQKLEYVKKMMTNVGTIVVPMSANSAGRPKIRDVKAATGVSLVGTFVPTLAVPILSMRAMIGGAAEEIATSQILYGGGVEDANKITTSIQHKIKLLEEDGKGLSPQKKQYIQSKLDSFTQLGSKIDAIEQLLISHITLKAQYPNKELVFTDADIDSFQKKQADDKRRMAEKLSKLQNLNGKLLYAKN